MVEKCNKTISVSRQCELLRIHRSGLYYTPSVESTENLLLMRKIDEQYFHTPFYGARKVTEWLKQKGHIVNIKRVKRLMDVVG
jgi:putative transposase